MENSLKARQMVMNREKKLFINSAVLVILMLVSLDSTHAQRKRGTYSIGVGGMLGLPLLSENFQEYWKNGFGVGSEFKFDINSMNSIGLRLNYCHYNVHDKKAIEEFEPLLQDVGTLGIHDGGYKNIQLGIHIFRYLLNPDGIVGFYLTGGSGCYMIHEEKLEVSVTASEISKSSPIRTSETFFKFGFSGGLGLEMRLKENLWFYLEGKIHYLITEGREVILHTGPLEKALGVVEANTSYVAIGSGLRFGSSK